MSAAGAGAWTALQEELCRCRACPRLVAWREQVARDKVRRFREETYWGRPVPSLGHVDARVMILGLAPAAHGANRTGRMFTGDQSGVWLYRALHRAGLCDRAESTHRGDGLTLRGCVISAAVHCAPPGNRPTVQEQTACSGFLDRELALLGKLRVVLALGGLAFAAYLQWCTRAGHRLPSPRPKFTHGVTVEQHLPHVLLASYHPSQQNTFTGRLTEPMLDGVMRRAAVLAGLAQP